MFSQLHHSQSSNPPSNSNTNTPSRAVHPPPTSSHANSAASPLPPHRIVNLHLLQPNKNKQTQAKTSTNQAADADSTLLNKQFPRIRPETSLSSVFADAWKSLKTSGNQANSAQNGRPLMCMDSESMESMSCQLKQHSNHLFQQMKTAFQVAWDAQNKDHAQLKTDFHRFQAETEAKIQDLQVNIENANARSEQLSMRLNDEAQRHEQLAMQMETMEKENSRLNGAVNLQKLELIELKSKVAEMEKEVDSRVAAAVNACVETSIQAFQAQSVHVVSGSVATDGGVVSSDHPTTTVLSNEASVPMNIDTTNTACQASSVADNQNPSTASKSPPKSVFNGDLNTPGSARSDEAAWSSWSLEEKKAWNAKEMEKLQQLESMMATSTEPPDAAALATFNAIKRVIERRARQIAKLERDAKAHKTYEFNPPA